MSFLLTCPDCGPRDVNEFATTGEVLKRSGAEATLRELTDYIYFRRNVAGVQREWWFHRSGCRARWGHAPCARHQSAHAGTARRAAL